MYKACIIDDSLIERNGLADLIQWVDFGINIVGKFSNGERLLKFIEQNQVDVVFTDIVMPKMNGMQLAEVLHENYPNIKVVFISSYDEFSYAKFAINLDIKYYILKPVIEEELVSAVRKIIEELEVEKIKNNKVIQLETEVNSTKFLAKSQLVRRLLFEKHDRETVIGFYNQMNIDANIYLHSRCVAIKYDCDPNSSYDSTIKSLEDEIICTEEFNVKNFIYKHSPNLTVLLLFSKTPEVEPILEMLKSFYEKFIELVEYDIVFGVSNCTTNLKNFDSLYRQAEHSLQYNFYANSNIVLYDKIKEYNKVDFTINVDSIKLYEQVKEIILNKDSSGIANLLDYFTAANGYSVEITRSIILTILNYIQIILYDLNISLTDYFENATDIWNKVFALKTIENMKNYLKNILNVIFKLNEYDKISRNARIILQVKDFVAKNYSKQISIEDIAKSMFISNKQCNTIFKAQENVSIFEYLTRYRMEQARHLLSQPNSKIYLVTDDVGYKNKSHFTITFKKYYGVTPMEYREKFSSESF